MTRWQGMRESKFVLRIWPTARAAFGFPARRATSLYGSTDPLGIRRTTANTRSWKVTSSAIEALYFSDSIGAFLYNHKGFCDLFRSNGSEEGAQHSCDGQCIVI